MLKVRWPLILMLMVNQRVENCAWGIPPRRRLQCGPGNMILVPARIFNRSNRR
jgi:hypothetical protein